MHNEGASAPTVTACYRFGAFLLDVDGRRLQRDGASLRVTSKAFDVLVLLVQRRDRIVSRNEVFDRLWPETAVEDNNLSQQVHRIRRQLGTDADGISAIATMPGRGFRFVWPVEEVAAPASWPPALPANRSSGGASWPTSVDPLLGRAEQLDEIHALVRSQQFVTLTGPGGVGKTRLAADVGWRMRDELPDEARWIDLTRATRPEDVVSLTAEALGLADAGGRGPIVRLRDWLADWDGLLVFDNFEHVLDAAPMLLQLRAPASTMRFLITSRVLLGVRGEHEYAVAPLPWGGGDGDVDDRSCRESPAVRLFLERYSAHVAAEDANTFDARDVAALCARLDGLPLAIELAAARARLVPPAELVGRDRLASFLPRALKDVPARQQSILQSIAWSYGLLDPRGQAALRVLAVFTGGFSARAGASVLVATGVIPDEAEAYDRIDQLRQHSLIAFERRDRSARLRMLETVREFCVETGNASEDARARAAHAAWVTALFVAESSALRSGQHVRAMEHLMADHGNLLAALRWSGQAGEVRLLVAATLAGVAFWHTANLFREAREWIDFALERTHGQDDIDEALRARLIAASALMAFHAGDWECCRARVDAILASEAVGEPAVLARCLDAGACAYTGDPAGALRRSRTALAAAEAHGERWLEGLAAIMDGFASSLVGDHEGAYRRLARTPRDIGFLDLWIDVNLALQALLLGRVEEAARLFGGRLRQRYGTFVPLRQIAAAIEGLGYVACHRGEWRTSVLLLAAAERLRNQTAPLSPVWFDEHDRAIDRVRTACRDRFDTLWAEGASLSLEEALGLAAQVAEPSASD